MCMGDPQRPHGCNMQKYFLGMNDPKNSLGKFFCFKYRSPGPLGIYLSRFFFLMMGLRITSLKTRILKLCLCVCRGACTEVCRCPQRPEVLDLPRAVSTVDDWVVTVGAGKRTPVLGEAVHTLPLSRLTNPQNHEFFQVSSLCASLDLFRTHRGSINCDRQTSAVCCIFPDSSVFAWPGWGIDRVSWDLPFLC